MSDIGKLYDSSDIFKICIEEKLGVHPPTEGKYLIKDGASANKFGSVFSGVSDSIALKVKSNYIIWDKFNTEGKFIKLFGSLNS